MAFFISLDTEYEHFLSQQGIPSHLEPENLKPQDITRFRYQLAAKITDALLSAKFTIFELSSNKELPTAKTFTELSSEHTIILLKILPPIELHYQFICQRMLSHRPVDPPSVLKQRSNFITALKLHHPTPNKPSSLRDYLIEDPFNLNLHFT